MTKTTTPTAATVYHVINFGRPVQLAEFPAGLEAVATVAIPAGATQWQALELAYQQTNNIHDSWTKNAGVVAQGQAAARGGARSTSIADVIELADGRRFEVSPLGFSELVLVY